MTTIQFKQGNIFNEGIGKYDLCLFYGSHGMAFGIGYWVIKDKYEVLNEIDSPFESIPNKAIQYSPNKYLVCVPGDYMSNEEFKDNLTSWLEFANKNKKIESIALTGVRDSSKLSITDISLAKQNDDNRVTFIVEILKDWLQGNKSTIHDVLLIAMSDNYIRNFNDDIILS